ncbi:MAG: hypothetical protein DYG89_41205 [Caldilinea sp. CFX5]|nr:hypothetical protein [Caldilinea sp. CFX5]
MNNLPIHAIAQRLLAQEARALLTRLARVKPFALHETMVPAAAPLPAAQAAIEHYLAQGRRDLRRQVLAYLRWLHSPPGQQATLAEAQRRFTFLRLRFNSVLTQFDIFSVVMTQRSEQQSGIWLAGLDLVAADALALPGDYYTPPPVVCYLDRGHGAAIRRARTRLPGGGENPVAVIRVPRERMVGSGIASSLVHEVGHQAVTLLNLINAFRPLLACLHSDDADLAATAQWWQRWLSEILADFWSVARVGVAAPLGLMGVVSLPRAFVFRINLDDPHPIPWIRVKLSCAMGHALYPHPQWAILAAIWEQYYPLHGLDAAKQTLLTQIERAIPAFVALLVNHRPPSLRGKSLVEALAVAERQPAHLQAHFEQWRHSPTHLRQTPPALAFAVIGQARADGKLGPEAESRLLGKLLTDWALRSTLDLSVVCAAKASAHHTNVTHPVAAQRPSQT